MDILAVSSLYKSFGGVKAISDIDIIVKEGEIVGIIGPNGAGKTTFFNLLTGIYKPSSGNITYKIKEEVSDKDFRPFRMTKYGVARTFQNIRLFKDMTVLENVLIGYHDNFQYGILSSIFHLSSYFKKEKKGNTEVEELLKIFDLYDKRHILSKNLPYGEQRKLEIARALASKPKLLLLDEPAAGMNANETRELTNLIKWIREEFNLTIILIEHDMSLVMDLCENLFVFDYGRLIAEGDPEAIQKNPKVIKAYLGGE